MKAKDLRKGSVVIYNGSPYKVMEFQHSTPGNLRGRVQVKMRNLLNGSQTETRFGSTEEIPEADVFSSRGTFLYKDQSGSHFMNSETFEQLVIDVETLGDSQFYLQEGMEVEISTYNDEPIGLSLPQTVILTVVDTEPEMKGATASGSPKPAVTDTGLSVAVPPFVKIGDRIVVNTDNGSYQSRAD